VRYSDPEIEKAVIACMVVDNSVIMNVANFLQDDDFSQETHRKLYKGILALNAEKRPVDVMVLLGLKIAEAAYIASLTDVVPSGSNWDFYAKKVKGYSLCRKFSAILESGKSFNEETVLERIADTARSALELADRAGASTKVKTFREVMPRICDRLSYAIQHKGELWGYDTGLSNLNDYLCGIQSEYIIIGARPSQGKAQPLNAKIKTVDGWKQMGDIAIGDKLASIDGKESIVTGIYPQGIKDVYRVTFSDGRTTECSGEHLWTVNNSRWTEPDKTVDTNFLIQSLKASRNRKRISIPLVNGDFGNDVGITIDPWLLGVLIGDGCLTKNTIRFTTADKEVLDRVSELSGVDTKITQNGKYDYRIVKEKHGHEFTDLSIKLSEMGLIGTNSFTKFIPKNYLSASRDVRIALLSGLITSDGEIGKNGTISFSTTSEKLKDGVIDLSRSLGVICEAKERYTRFTYKGVKKQGAKSFRINLLMNNKMKEEVLFLTRHRERINHKRARNSLLTITKIEKVRDDKVQCIMVSHQSHTYITDNYIVTHNTALGLQLALTMAKKGHKGVFFQLEMSDEAITFRAISSESGINIKMLKSGFVDSGKPLEKVQRAMTNLVDIPIAIEDNVKEIHEICARIRYLVRCEDYKWAMIDHLSKVTTSNNRVPKVEQASEISGMLQDLRKELNIPIIALAQLRRDAEGKTPCLADLRDSGSYEQDADTIIFIDREREHDANTIPTDLIIAKQRDGAVGVAKTVFFPQMVTFKDAAIEKGDQR
jgi:replicative DNA helicase